jgi:hypothetical protein
MNLVAIRRDKNGKVIGWHVEVQISFRPVGYIAKLPKGTGVHRTSVRARTVQEVGTNVRNFGSKQSFAPSQRSNCASDCGQTLNGPFISFMVLCATRTSSK